LEPRGRGHLRPRRDLHGPAHLGDMTVTPQISDRARRMPASPIRKLMPLADEAKRRGVRVYHLNIGQPDLETPAVMRERLRAAPKVLAYTPSGGTPEYVAAVQDYYRRIGIELSPGEIVATTGGSAARPVAVLAPARQR